MSRLVNAGLAVAYGAMALTGIAFVSIDNEPELESEGALVTLGGVIRLGEGGPYIHENSSHANLGLTGVGMTTKGDLEVWADRPEGAQAVFASADEDETLSRLGIECGISGGGEYSVISCHQDGTRVPADSPLYGTTGNVWLTLVMWVPGGAS